MARFVATAEKIEEINRLYYEIGVKAEVARRVGCSASTVSKYIDPEWKPTEERPEIQLPDSVKPTGPNDMIIMMSCADDPVQAFCDCCIMSPEEWEQLQEIQKLYAIS